MLQGRRKRRLMAEMNVVPYIDVMLVLLIIFMVTSPMLSMSEGVEVDLPEVKASSADPSAHIPIVIKITRAGAYFMTDGDVFDEPYPLNKLQHLRDHVLALHRAQPQRPIVLSGDQNVSYGNVIKVMALLEGSGIKVRLLTRPVDENKNVPVGDA